MKFILIFFVGMVVGGCLGFVVAAILTMARDEAPEFDWGGRRKKCE